MNNYRHLVATEIEKLEQTPVTAISQPASASASASTLNSTIEQERLAFEKEKLNRHSDRLQVVAEARCKAVKEDIDEFAKKYL